VVAPDRTKASSSMPKDRPMRRPVSSRSIASRSRSATPDGPTKPLAQLRLVRAGSRPTSPCRSATWQRRGLRRTWSA
jgi:hypothetical protein